MLTLDQLKKRGRALANRCFLCCEEDETIGHLLVHCTKARILWDMTLVLVGVSWPFPLTVKDTLFSWKGSFVGKKQRKTWMVAPFCRF